MLRLFFENYQPVLGVYFYAVKYTFSSMVGIERFTMQKIAMSPPNDKNILVTAEPGLHVDQINKHKIDELEIIYKIKNWRSKIAAPTPHILF